MRYLKLFAIALAALQLSACVGFIVPIPLSSSAAPQSADEKAQR